MKLFLTVVLFLLLGASGLEAQQFVDAPPVLDTPPPAQVSSESVEGFSVELDKGTFNQLSVGVLSYGYKKHVFAQFTGDLDYQRGSGPSSAFGNLSFLRVTKTDIGGVIRGFAWGGEWAHFSADPTSVAGDQVIIAPPVTMSMNMWTVNGRMYFGDFDQQMLQPFLGIGFGLLNGTMDGTLASNVVSKSSFKGLIHFNTIGANLKVSKQWGVIIDLRTVRAPKIKSSADPYNQAPGDLYLNFSGNMLNVTGYMQF